MINIKLKNHTLTSDSNCFILNEVKKRGEDSKEAGEEYLHIVGYYTSLSTALGAYADRVVLKSDCTDLKQISDLIEELRSEIFLKYETAIK